MKCKTNCCPTCGSSHGEIEVSNSLGVTVEVLRKNKGPKSREEIHALTKGEKGVLTATFHRINRLVRMGVVRSTGEGRPERFELI